MGREQFTSRWGLIASLLGMAIGAGNLWRFPRVAAQNGGGAFLIPWALFLFLWSVPLMLVEFGMGRAARRGPIGAFGAFLGRFGVVPGVFVAFCTTAIMFYYAVVTGWCAYYTVALAVDFGGVTGNASGHWKSVSHHNWVTVAFHAAAMTGGVLVVSGGVARGIERVNKVLIPLLVVLLVCAAVAGISLPGGTRGLEFLFHVDMDRLTHHKTWLEALSQSAWSTGAGWGLILTYAVYTRKKEDVLLNSLVAGVGNNAASLLAAMAILPAVFALAGPQADKALGAGNTGLLFVWMPQLFARIAGGQLLAVAFFLAVTVAALSSLLSMLELATRVIMDLGFDRRRAVLIIGVVGFMAGLPSALHLDVFNNQDWVWGLGLILSGAFFALAAMVHGVKRFRTEQLRPAPGGWRTGWWFDVLIYVAIPLEFVAMLGWWFYSVSRKHDFATYMNPAGIFTVGSCLLQWGVLLGIAALVSGWVYRRVCDPSLDLRGGRTP